MTKTFATVLLLALLGGLPQHTKCLCGKVSDDEVAHGANEVVEYKERAVRQIKGMVRYAYNETPVEDVVVEVFDITDDVKDHDAYQIASLKKRRAACLTGKDGRFCFDNLPSGRYVLRAGTRTSAGMQEVHMRINLDRHWWSRWLRSGKDIELELRPGT